MVDRTDLVSAAAYFILSIVSVAALFGFGSLSPANLYGFLIGILAFSFLFLYPAFWAFSIRRALAVRLYRNQALGIGLVCVSFAISFLDNTGVGYGIALLVIFYWIDASFLAARRSDPLLRDTLHWSKLRIIFWALSIFTVIPTAIYQILTGNGPSAPGNDLLGVIFIAFFILIPASGIGLFAVASRRSGDHALRRHLAWFGLFVLSQSATITIALFGGGATYFLGFAVGGFCLYKSARSLVPLNRLSLA